MNRLFTLFILISISASAQDIQVEYDKARDLSKYKTFRMGESEVITPKDQKQANEATLQKDVKTAIAEELREKGLTQIDSLGDADLVVSFVAGSLEKSDFQSLGPLGTSPGNSSQIWSRDFRMGSLIIDLNDRSNNLIWRVNATTTSSTTDTMKMVDQVVSAGFKKFSLKPKKVKKKK